MKAAVDNKETEDHDCIPIQLYLQEQAAAGCCWVGGGYGLQLLCLEIRVSKDGLHVRKDGLLLQLLHYCLCDLGQFPLNLKE